MYGNCSQKLFILSKIRKFINECVVLRLYKALILSLIDYGDACYRGANKGDLNRLQNKALRIVNLSPRYTSNISLHKQYKVVPLYVRRQQNLLKIIHSYIAHNPMLISVPRVVNNGLITTRQSTAPYIPLKVPKSSKYAQSCAQKGPSFWLDLPLDMRREYDCELFKMRVKQHLLEQLDRLHNVFEL